MYIGKTRCTLVQTWSSMDITVDENAVETRQIENTVHLLLVWLRVIIYL